MSQNDETVVRLRQGLDAAFGDAQVGVAQVRGDEAVLSVRRRGAKQKVKMTVRAGEVVPLDGALYRVVAVHADSRPTVLPGASDASVVIEAKPVSLGALTLHADSLAIPLGATANAAGFDFEVVSLGADATAKLEVWPDEFARPQTRPELIKSFAVKGGGKISAGERQLSIVAVVPSNERTGLRGFIEVGW